jgi:hypothetical protein
VCSSDLVNEPDYSDAPYCFVITDISKEQFEAEYGDEITDWENDGTGWVTDDTVRIAEYFEVKETAAKIYLLEDGSIVEDLPEGVQEVKERDTLKRNVIWRKIYSYKVHEEKEFPCPWIPIVPVLGKEEIDRDGKKHYISLTRHAKDPQKNFNYYTSMNTENIALSPKKKWVGAEGQFEGHEAEWADANMSSDAYLQYKLTDFHGHLVPPPRLTEPSSVDPAAISGMAQANQDLKETTGIFDASLGNTGNESSGIAIRERKSEGDTATFHFVDNQAIAINHCMRIIITLLPKNFGKKNYLWQHVQKMCLCHREDSYKYSRETRPWKASASTWPMALPERHLYNIGGISQYIYIYLMTEVCHYDARS